jgi:hypothetical protein
MNNYDNIFSQEEDDPNINPPASVYQQDPEVGIIKELSPKKVLEMVRMELKGYYYDYTDKEYKKVRGIEPLMNDEGIEIFMYSLSASVSDLVTFSNYNEEEVNTVAMYICEKCLPVLHINYKKYGIKEKSHLELIDAKLFSLTLSALKKAMFAGDRGVIKKGYQETMDRNFAPQQGYPPQNKSFLGRVNPFT